MSQEKKASDVRRLVFLGRACGRERYFLEKVVVFSGVMEARHEL